jgi:DNA-binding IclR family transcriptional regulator
MKTDNRARKEVSQTLMRGLALLEAIADGKEGVAVRDLAAAMGLPRSIVQRLLYTLEAEGFLERHPSQVGYRPAIKLWTLGCAAARGLNAREVARPFLEHLAQKTHETIKLGVLDGRDVVYLDGIECPQSVRAYVPVGGRAPAHSSATGKAILAFLRPDTLAQIGPSMRRYTRRTFVGAESLAKELEQIRKRGYAVNGGEWDEQVGGVAAPLFDGRGEVVASLGIILPLNRLTAAKTVQMGAWTTAAAAEISARLGYRAGNQRPTLKRAG